MIDQLSVVDDGATLVIAWSDGSAQRCNRFWLRDNCPSEGDRASLFRSRSIDELPDDLTIAAATLAPASDRSATTISVEFSDGMADEFDVEWLLANRPAFGAEPGAIARPAKPWRGDHVVATFAFDALGAGTVGHLDLLEELTVSGVALVGGLADASATETLASRLGRIRDTDFGRLFDIVVEPDPFTPSQSPTALDPHTDDPYRYNPSGMSILHCVQPSSGEGGASTVVDGFAVAESVRRADPAAFDVLSTVAVPFVHERADAADQGDPVNLRAEAPIIALDAAGRLSGIRFHERSMGTLRLDADLAERFYRSLMMFTRAIRHPAFTWTHKLGPGEAIVYDNQRVLHGRTGFEGSQTRRHLRLCTVDRDQVHSRLRRLRETHGAGTEHDPLPAGNLS